jgi:hypothetical protein
MYEVLYEVFNRACKEWDTEEKFSKALDSLRGEVLFGEDARVALRDGVVGYVVFVLREIPYDLRNFDDMAIKLPEDVALKIAVLGDVPH